MSRGIRFFGNVRMMGMRRIASTSIAKRNRYPPI
jgi:hypothetical protein